MNAPAADLALAAELTRLTAERDALAAENARLREALECWPLRELLGEIEDAGSPALWEKARWFMEVRAEALAARALVEAPR